MKNTVWYVCIACCLVLAGPVFADQVEHHGRMMPVDLSAEGCLSCHDGSMAHIVSYCTVQCDFSTSHVIFKRYPPRKNSYKFAPRATVVAKGIRLQNGKVTCVSCHDMRNTSSYHLVGNATKDNLCIICHIRM